ncbi:mannose-1-phosphate guanylyltransferase/mannose-6-phosphate isomerase [Providencia manganoxydans]|uniref:mannose-1-phosphate guanylyltransferase/mannose-6-phosphate isomerase n=1 Tax=Providencia manganoxydans TaxID=2923283 RepID=UPI003AF3CCA8
MKIQPVILAGGSGSRLWPLSRSLYPKQFISLATQKTLLQETVHRLNTMDCTPPIFICNTEHRFIVSEQLKQEHFSHNGIILEPIGRNTAPAIALAALKATSNNNDSLLLILAADHLIQDQVSFSNAIHKAVPFAEQGSLITFGIVPTAPETGYGYIKRGDCVDDIIHTVERFVEKPDLETAKYYLDSREYLWNSGMFLFKASSYLKELQKYHPDILRACKLAISNAHIDLDFIRIEQESFEKCPENSIDYAVMEKADNVLVVPMDAGWSDVGSFSSLWDVSTKDEESNVLIGDVLTDSTTNSYIYSQSKLVATVGIDNLVIVETKDAVLVANKDKVQDVKNIVSQLNKLGRNESKQHREAFRPWGSHDEIAIGERFQVKHLKIQPGEKTALQMHYHRTEHWIVVQGTAKVTNGDNTYILSENESTYIPIAIPHQIENPGKTVLHLIEVRSGNYLEEDDIVRLKEYTIRP